MSSSEFGAQTANTPDQFDKIRELVRGGNKIEAIKIYRGMTSVGLKEAKDAVEALAAGQSIQVPALAAASPTLENSAEPLAEIKRLVQQGNKIEAIKIYRRMTNVGLSEAKTAVEALAAGQPVALPTLAAVSPALSTDAQLLDEVKHLLGQGKRLTPSKSTVNVTTLGWSRRKTPSNRWKPD
jgi:ribosomal protein L7/L12